jgi:hypothetical protein
MIPWCRFDDDDDDDADANTYDLFYEEGLEVSS